MAVLNARIGGVWVPVGGGTEEVSVGPTAPTDPGIEMWYDTDAPNVLTSDQRWYTAWGIVAEFPRLTSPVNINTITAITGNLSFTFQNGRRYRVVASIRAIQVTTAGRFDITLYDGAGVPYGTNSHSWVSGNFGDVHTEWFVTGTGQTNSALHFRAVGNTQSVWVEDPSQFYIEDIGPTIGTSIVPPQSSAGFYRVNHYFNGLSANTTMPNNPTKTTLCTINMPAAPAGTLLHIFSVTYMNLTTIGTGGVVMEHVLNGVILNPAYVCGDIVLLASWSGGSANIPAPVDTAYTILLRGFKFNTGTSGTATAQGGNNTALSVIEYRP
jgi:hypothetical protein